LSRPIIRAGEWFLRSGIQQAGGGVARYYRTDLQRNQPVSTEITGYTASALVYLHAVTTDERYLAAAVDAARFLACTAWDAGLAMMPFELEPPRFSYFFDCGIIVRGLLAVWRATGSEEFLDAAAALGRSMARDFRAPDGWHPIVSAPERQPEPRDDLRWSRSTGCYQLKSAMAWFDLAEALSDPRLAEPYERTVELALADGEQFLPGHPQRLAVMDRLHAFLYFLEGLLPRAGEARCALAIERGLARAAKWLREIAPEFARSDVYAQLLRMRVYADFHGAAPLDEAAAAFEAEQLRGFQAVDADSRIDGGFYFGRKQGEWMPYANPVSTAFAMQALELWEGARAGGTPPLRHLLI
jgi:hypothetical protein